MVDIATDLCVAMVPPKNLYNEIAYCLAFKTDFNINEILNVYVLGKKKKAMVWNKDIEESSLC